MVRQHQRRLRSTKTLSEADRLAKNRCIIGEYYSVLPRHQSCWSVLTRQRRKPLSQVGLSHNSRMTVKFGEDTSYLLMFKSRGNCLTGPIEQLRLSWHVRTMTDVTQAWRENRRHCSKTADRRRHACMAIDCSVDYWPVTMHGLIRTYHKIFIRQIHALIIVHLFACTLVSDIQ